MTGDWRDFRPAIWLTMIGIAIMLLAPFYFGAIFIGMAIGVALKTLRRRQRAAAIAAAKPLPRPGSRRPRRG